MSPLLLAGLSLVFAAIVLAIAATGALSGGTPRSGVARSLAAVEAIQRPRRDLRERDLDRPFTDRVLDPMADRFTAVGRRFTPEERILRIRRRLDLAGNPAGWDADRVLGLKALASLVGTLFGLVLPPIFGFGAAATVFLLLLGGVLGWLAPSLWLYQVAYDRSQRVRRELPDALDLLTISVESGLAFDAGLAQVARRTTGPLAQEFFRVLQEMQIGTGRVQAMRALADRTDVPELRSFVGAMIQADAFGIPISGVLRVQAREMRVKRSQRAEELAQKVPVKILFPLIFCILPCLFLVIMGPAVITLINNFSGRF
ncbi:MAG TPA: type II secretion system F family protein [Kineosporiaceae bacterium]|nr:type II secretion system F family protein [Kineosporiaceae bacterium]